MATKTIPRGRVLVLTREVLVVSVVTVGSWGACWTAFIGVVPGRNHDEEWQHVRDYGDTLREEHARGLFPEFADLAYDR